MTIQSTYPNCQQLLAELERLQAQLEEARNRIAALEADVRQGRRQAVPISRDEPIRGRRPGRGQFTYWLPQCGTPHGPRHDQRMLSNYSA